jgi:hypothetical protein
VVFVLFVAFVVSEHLTDALGTPEHLSYSVGDHFLLAGLERVGGDRDAAFSGRRDGDPRVALP